MPSTTQRLMEKGLLSNFPPFLRTNIHYETIMGSHAYGVADTSVRDKLPDFDIYGFGIPPKEVIFPHLAGHFIMFGQKTGKMLTFGPPPKGFEQAQEHHVIDQDANAGKGKEYDLNIYNIVKYFQLCWDNNPNMIDSLYTPENCVVHCTQVGRMVRDARKMFLSKRVWIKFRGYAHSQLKKMNDKNPEGDRIHIVEKFGYDVKFAYHLIRLFDECEQLLTEGDMDIQRAREMMKSIRRGEWTADEVRKWVMEKERNLETVYANCSLPEEAPFEPLRQLLMNCLEQHYGSLDNCIATPGWAEHTLRDIDRTLENVRMKLYS